MISILYDIEVFFSPGDIELRHRIGNSSKSNLQKKGPTLSKKEDFSHAKRLVSRQ